MNRKAKKIAFNIFIIILLAIAFIWICSRFIHFGNVEFTDNAQVRQHILPVNSRIQGFIKEIRFEEYQKVLKGDTLVIIEDSEFRFRLRQAEADYQNALSGKTVAHSTINTIQNNIAVSDAGVQEAQIRLNNSEREYRRYENLLAQNAVTRQQYDAIKTEYEANKARYNQLTRQKESTALVKQEQTNRLEQTDAGIKLAEAALELARLNLSYTVITAPCNGTTGRKEIQEGQLIQPGQTMVSLVNEHEKWVIANYRETQLTHIHKDAVVEIQADAVPGVTFKGKVTAISNATGAAFSLIPQDNATGNFVKVEQRVPVRISLEGNHDEDLDLLRAGLNVECEILY